jgi:hypothetical protein
VTTNAINGFGHSGNNRGDTGGVASEWSLDSLACSLFSAVTGDPCFSDLPGFSPGTTMGGGTVACVSGVVLGGSSGSGIQINDAARKISPRKLRTMNVELRIS